MSSSGGCLAVKLRQQYRNGLPGSPRPRRIARNSSGWRPRSIRPGRDRERSCPDGLRNRVTGYMPAPARWAGLRPRKSRGAGLTNHRCTGWNTSRQSPINNGPLKTSSAAIGAAELGPPRVLWAEEAPVPPRRQVRRARFRVAPSRAARGEVSRGSAGHGRTRLAGSR